MTETLLGHFELSEAKLIQIRLKDLGIDCEIRANDQTCNTKNCKVTVELWGEESDLPKVTEFFRQQFFKNLGTTELNYEALNAVFDPSAELVLCQACGTKFAPTLSECPDCGLCY
ncbi:MAG: hypothetical protein ACOYL6_05810 [Bacteriovoracaceae bacterium]